jgi:hypothetical protein
MKKNIYIFVLLQAGNDLFTDFTSLLLSIFRCLYPTGGRWHLNWGEQAHGNDWIGLSGMESTTSNTWIAWFPW